MMKILPLMHLRAFLLFALILLFSCDQPKQDLINEAPAASAQECTFELLNATSTGITFNNTIVESNAENIILYDYLYNGAGVGIGDFNHDGLQDVYFAGNQVPDELYYNEGNFKFSFQNKLIKAKLKNSWSSGVSVVDINNDGWDDIYISRTGPGSDPERRRNCLLINQEGRAFVDEAAKYGLDHTGHTTQSVFFDYDRDGDLDCYLMSHPASFAHSFDLKTLAELYKQGLLESDVLLRNDDGKFVDVSKSSGLIEDRAFGLGIVCDDFNKDGWPDLYVSNDFDEGDLLYINNRNGGFSNEITKLLKHTSNFGMGCDAADFNNDTWPDLMTVDMAFEDHERSKRNMASMDPLKFEVRKQLGWHHQYMQNCLHLNRQGKVFSEIAQMSGVAKSDWSWSTLFCDLNNDTQKDIFITNGYKRDTRDNDLKAKILAFQETNANPSIQDVLSVFPSTLIANKLFINGGDLMFKDEGEMAGINQAMHSHGAAYADFDNDGDLDLIVNNVDEAAVIFKNQLNPSKNWIQIDLAKSEQNGAVCYVYEKGEVQMQRLERVRGYASSVSSVLHFGLQNAEAADSVLVQLLNGELYAFDQLEAGQKHQLDFSSARKTSPKIQELEQIFTEKAIRDILPYKHEGNAFNDFARETLLPHKLSSEGPFMAEGDINGDGLIDLWIGGDSGKSGAIYVQTPDGRFRGFIPKALKADALYEDAGALWFDADMDGDLDLYVVTGGSEFEAGSSNYQDRLYVNDGRGVLSKDVRLPSLKSSGSQVLAFDLEKDGDNDLLVLGRHVPGLYPSAPRSFVLKNQDGRFEIDQASSALVSSLGMLSDAALGDLNGDGIMELVLVGEWTSVNILEFDEVEMKLSTNFSIEAPNLGWWNCIKLADVDKDGDLDLIAGNVGLNNKFSPSETHPLHVFASDFDGNGTNDIVLAKTKNDELLPVRGRECSSQQMPFIAQKFSTYEAFAKAKLSDVFSPQALEEALHLQMNQAKSGVFLNESGDLSFIPFPNEAQLSPIKSMLCSDVNADGFPDLIFIGNQFNTEVETVRYDAGIGGVLLGDGSGKFVFVDEAKSGLMVPGDAKDLVEIPWGNQKLLIATSNNSFLKLFER